MLKYSEFRVFAEPVIGGLVSESFFITKKQQHCSQLSEHKLDIRPK